MKKYFVIIILVLWWNSTSAQTFASNAVIWNTPLYCTPAMTIVPGNNYFEVRSVGSTSQSYFSISKFDSVGTPLWEKLYDWNPTQSWHEEIHCIASMPDSGVVLGGFQCWAPQQSQGPPYAYHVIRLDKNGQSIWMKKFSLNSMQLHGKIHMKIASSGVITLMSAGRNNTSGESGIHFLQCDANGNYLNQALISMNNSTHALEDAIMYGGDTLVVSGYFMNWPFILKINNSLQLVTGVYGTTYLRFYNILYHPDGHFYAAARSSNHNTSRITVLRMNNAFQVVDSMSFQYASSTYRIHNFACGPFPSSNIYIGGSETSGCYGSPTSTSCYLLTIDTGLQVISSYKYFGEGPRTLVPNKDGAVLSTMTYLGATGEFAINYFQTDTTGLLNCNFESELPAIVADPAISTVNWIFYIGQTNNVLEFYTSPSVANAWNSFAFNDFCLFDSDSEITEKKEMQVSPNPTSELITITGVSGTHNLITITSIDGQVLMQKLAMEGMIIDLSHLAGGCYFICIINANEQMIQRKLIIKY